MRQLLIIFIFSLALAGLSITQTSAQQSVSVEIEGENRAGFLSWSIMDAIVRDCNADLGRLGPVATIVIVPQKLIKITSVAVIQWSCVGSGGGTSYKASAPSGELCRAGTELFALWDGGFWTKKFIGYTCKTIAKSVSD